MIYVTDFRAIWEGDENGRWNSVGMRTDPVVVSYHFNAGPELPGRWEVTEYVDYVEAADPFQQSVIRAQLEKIEDVAGIRFVEVDNPDLSMMDFSIVGGSYYGGWAFLPESHDSFTETSDIFLDESGITFAEKWARGLSLHEVMHALGLTHPHEGRYRLYDWMDKPAYTLMTYNGYDDRLGSLDKDALRYLYGPSIDRADLTFEELRDGLRITGSDADDTIIGVKGNSVLNGGGGDDRLIGREGDDLLRGGDGADRLSGLHGKDRLIGGAGGDALAGGVQRDRLFGQNGADHLKGGAGGDRLNGGNGGDRMFGQASDDWLTGGGGADRMYGGSGADTLLGGNRADRLFGGDSDDGLWGEKGGDHLVGGAGNDLLRGGAQDDVLRGQAGSDDLDGGTGRDWLDGGTGSDILRGGRGADILTGGAGRDTFVFLPGDGGGKDRITDFRLGEDVLSLGFRALSDARLAPAQGGASVDLAFDDDGQALRLEGVTQGAFEAYYGLG